MRKSPFIFLFCYFSLSFCFESKDPFEVYINEGLYENGQISTAQGGFVKGKDFYLQAMHLRYKKLAPALNEVEAEGGVCLYKNGILFVGKSCFYDFNTKKGVISSVRASVRNWQLIADKICFNPDGSIEAFDATITSSDTLDIYFKLCLKKIKYYSNGDLHSSSAQFKLFNTPLFWIPKFQTNLKKESSSLVSYTLNLDAGQGPQIGLKYKIYDSSTSTLLLRADYRYARGPAGALEYNYLSLDEKTKIKSKNYLAYDTFYNDDQPNLKQKRFRLQGLLTHQSDDHLKKLELVFDRISDKNMPQDFNLQDFEFNPFRKTYLKGSYNQESYQARVNIEPRINNYLGFNQKLPSIDLAFRPWKVFNSPFLFFNNFKTSFYDYTYSKILIYPKIYQRALSNFHAVRFQSDQKITSSFNTDYFSASGFAGFKTIVYSHSPDQYSKIQGLFHYGAKVESPFLGHYDKKTHLLSSYLEYQGIYKPLKQPDQIYIFSLDDGYHLMNFIKIGLSQSLYEIKKENPLFELDLYALGFTADQTYQLFIPKVGFSFSLELLSVRLKSDLRWNLNNKILDFSNIYLEYTLSQLLAFYLEFRYRGPYDFRKCDHQNFILDVSRPIIDLYNSPLSDKRATLLARAEAYITPLTKTRISFHSGWGRNHEPGYTEGKLDLITQLSTLWSMKLSYMYTTRGSSHFSIKIKLNN